MLLLPVDPGKCYLVWFAVISFVDFDSKHLLARFHTVYIIHGFGTGAVRKAVYEALKLNKNVKETRFGGEGEGLNGCTVVTLK
jgi:dsDNA-specific endonuclease/ATPase MutS2